MQGIVFERNLLVEEYAISIWRIIRPCNIMQATRELDSAILPALLGSGQWIWNLNVILDASRGPVSYCCTEPWAILKTHANRSYSRSARPPTPPNSWTYPYVWNTGKIRVDCSAMVQKVVFIDRRSLYRVITGSFFHWICIMHKKSS